MKFGKTIEDASKLTQDANNRLVTDAEKTAWNNKVDNSRVLTNVPANAKFTDTNTTYSEITTAEIDAGTASTLRTITGRRIKYILDKVNTMISTAISGLTKSDVGLGNVTNESKTTMFTSPAFTGNPTAPTQAKGNNSTRVATTAFVQSAMADVGVGDMLKSVYDKDGDGVVDKAKDTNTLGGFTVANLNNNIITVGTVQPTNGWWFKEI